MFVEVEGSVQGRLVFLQAIPVMVSFPLVVLVRNRVAPPVVSNKRAVRYLGWVVEIPRGFVVVFFILSEGKCLLLVV